jgi:hypothetical protein
MQKLQRVFFNFFNFINNLTRDTLYSLPQSFGEKFPTSSGCADLHTQTDDTHVVGTPEAVIAAILDIRERYAVIGLSLAPTTSSKNILYGLGKEYTDQQRASATEVSR